MARMSRTKGKVGEREVAALLREHGFEGARGVQYQGGRDSADVVGLPGFHIEVKRVEAFRLYEALEQAKGERKPGDIPAVFHRPNMRPWVVVLEASDFLSLVRAAGIVPKEAA
jgi:Holliday junction resolvase